MMLSSLMDLWQELEMIGTALSELEQRYGYEAVDLQDARRRQLAVRGVVFEQLCGALATAPAAPTIH